jgi:hypothetical protein
MADIDITGLSVEEVLQDLVNNVLADRHAQPMTKSHMELALDLSHFTPPTSSTDLLNVNYIRGIPLMVYVSTTILRANLYDHMYGCGSASAVVRYLKEKRPGFVYS